MVNYYYKEADQPARRPQKATQNVETTAVPVSSLTPAQANLVPQNEHVDIETTNEITPAAVPISSNLFPMVVLDCYQNIAAKQWENLITGVFHSPAEFRKALRKYLIAHAFNLVSCEIQS